MFGVLHVTKMYGTTNINCSATCSLQPRHHLSFHTGRKFLCFHWHERFIWRGWSYQMDSSFASTLFICLGELRSQITLIIVFTPVYGSSVYPSSIIDRWLKTCAVNRKNKQCGILCGTLQQREMNTHCWKRTKPNRHTTVSKFTCSATLSSLQLLIH
jgi:hypothetical protein